MGSPIDPVTGLPMVGVPDVVSQIPLGKQVVPFADLDAISRPQQGPAYPNDILNTFSYVTGEDTSQPGSVRAGTMTPDRRLRVDSASSGGNPQPVSILKNTNSHTPLSSGWNDLVTSIRGGVSILYGYVFAVHNITDTGTDETQRIDVAVSNTDQSDILCIGSMWLPQNSTEPVAPLVVMFPVPLDILSMFGGANDIGFAAYCTDISADAVICPFVATVP